MVDFHSIMYAQEADVDLDHPLESCLLDRKIFIGTSTNANATTTRYEINDPDGKRADIVIQVSLFVARPPRVSNILIWCAGTRFTEQPVVVATFGGLVLLSIAFRQQWSSQSQFFLYQPGAPSLCLIPPQPSGGMRLEAHHSTACILPHGGNGDYLITALVNEEEPGEFDLFLYSSMTQTWTIKRPVLMVPGDGSFALHTAYKAIPVCGSMVAFVDIWTGILFCDVLDGERPKLHHLPLPSTSLSKESTPRVSSVWVPRDVVIQKVSDSGDLLRIRFIEVVCRPIFESWHATFWSTTTAVTTPWCQLKDWHKYSEDVSDLDLSVADGVCYDGLLPETSECDSDDTLGSLYLHMPTMCLHQDNVVCFIAKHYMNKSGTWTIAVDMANKILQGVYRCVRLTTEISYSTISSHVDITAPPVVKGDRKRLGAQLESYPHKKIYHDEQMVTSPVDEQHQGIMATQDGDDMDLEQE